MIEIDINDTFSAKTYVCVPITFKYLDYSDNDDLNNSSKLLLY